MNFTTRKFIGLSVYLLACTTILVITTGCASFFVRDFRGPDGTPWHSTQCDSIDVCYSRAGTVCHHGFDIKNLQGYEQVVTVGQNNNVPSNPSTSVVRGTRMSMMFSCK